MTNANWNEVCVEASKIAQVAAEKEIAQMIEDGPQYMVGGEELYDLCGGAYVKFIDLRSSAYRSYKKFVREEEDNPRYDPYGMFHSYYHSGRQEWRVNKAVAYAIKDYLNSVFGQGTVTVKTYID